jgi:hypothetical protein
VEVSESARSARQHKARGVSPGEQAPGIAKPAERAIDLMTAIFAENISSLSHKIAHNDSGQRLSPAPRAGHICSPDPGAHAPGFMLALAPRAS